MKMRHLRQTFHFWLFRLEFYLLWRHYWKKRKSVDIILFEFHTVLSSYIRRREVKHNETVIQQRCNKRDFDSRYYVHNCFAIVMRMRTLTLNKTLGIQVVVHKVPSLWIAEYSFIVNKKLINFKRKKFM